jgi:hypothetical protein
MGTRTSLRDRIGSGTPSGPETEVRCSRTGCTTEDGSDAGEATYPVMINVGEEIIAGSNERFRVLEIVSIDDENSRLVGLLKVEAA